MTNSIRLLDDTDHHVDDLLENMMSDDFYYGYLGRTGKDERDSICRCRN